MSEVAGAPVTMGRKKQPEGEFADKGFGAAVPETPFEVLPILDEIIAGTDPDDPRLGALLLLRHQLQVDREQLREAGSAIRELQEAYEQLTSPANRIGTFLDSPEEGIALVALGDGEYYANVDPQLELDTLERGESVMLNDAYAVVGSLGVADGGAVVKLSDVLDDGRLRVATDSTGQAGRILHRGARLEDVTLRNGDEVRLDSNTRVALEHFPREETKDYYFETVPKTPWSAVGGQEDAIQVIRETIELPLLHPELFERFEKKPLKGILLYGPPGCGKTLIGKATAYNLTQEYRDRTAKDVEQHFMFISGPQILNMWVGESERIVREIFSAAREKARGGDLVFIFIDEAESILRTRTAGVTFNIANTVVPQFASEMDGLLELQNVVVMLTSNRPDYIDPAILRPERIDRRVKVGRPDRGAAKDIFDIYLHERVPLDPGLVEEHGDEGAAREALVEHAARYLWRKNEQTAKLEVDLRNGRTETLHWRDLVSGALIMSAVERAKDLAIRRSIDRESDQEGLSRDDIAEAIRRECAENEIFPKSDTQEDWLKLLDHEPENVAAVRPVRKKDDGPKAKRRVI